MGNLVPYCTVRFSMAGALSTKPKQTNPKELTPRAQAKREQIRAAAQELFLERGFTGASTDAISSQAGVSKETLYKHFPSKEELLADCLRHLIADSSSSGPIVTEYSRSLDDLGDLRRALLGMAHGLVASLMQAEYQALVRVIINETPRLPQLGELFRSTIPQSAFRGVRTTLKEAQERRITRDVDADAAARMFVGPLLTYVLLDGLLVGEGPIRLPPDKRIEAVVDLYLLAIATP